MSLPSFIRAHETGTYLSIKVQPRASRNEIGEPLGDELKIKVTAPPVDSAANQAVIELLAKQFKVGRGSVQIVRGQTSKHKTIFITGRTPQEIVGLLY